MSKVVVARIRLAWWFWPYLNTLMFFCYLFDTEPDWNRVDAIILKALVVEPC